MNRRRGELPHAPMLSHATVAVSHSPADGVKNGVLRITSVHSSRFHAEMLNGSVLGRMPMLQYSTA